jgi:hypothetical protein
VQEGDYPRNFQEPQPRQKLWVMIDDSHNWYVWSESRWMPWSDYVQRQVGFVWQASCSCWHDTNTDSYFGQGAGGAWYVYQDGQWVALQAQATQVHPVATGGRPQPAGGSAADSAWMLGGINLQEVVNLPRSSPATNSLFNSLMAADAFHQLLQNTMGTGTYESGPTAADVNSPVYDPSWRENGLGSSSPFVMH